MADDAQHSKPNLNFLGVVFAVGGIILRRRNKPNNHAIDFDDRHKSPFGCPLQIAVICFALATIFVTSSRPSR